MPANGTKFLTNTLLIIIYRKHASYIASISLYAILSIHYTVKPPIVNPLRKGHCIRNLSIVDTSWDPKILFSYSSNTI